MARLGSAAEAICAVNPRDRLRLGVGWGQDGPLAPLPGLDIMAQARSGLMSITGTPDGDPVKVGVPICDLVCGLYLALGVTAALHERDRTGVGQSIDVSLFEAGVSLAVWEAGKYFATGEVGGPLGSAHQSQAPYQAVRTADGWVTIGANTPNTWAGCAARWAWPTNLLPTRATPTPRRGMPRARSSSASSRRAPPRAPRARWSPRWARAACRARRSTTTARCSPTTT